MPQKRTESIYGIFTLSTSRFNFTPSGGHEPPKTFVINDHSVQRRQLEYYFIIVFTRHIKYIHMVVNYDES